MIKIAIILGALLMTTSAWGQGLLIGGGNSPQEFYASKPYPYAAPVQKPPQQQQHTVRKRKIHERKKS
jgi:hypothetical protein